MFIWLDRIATAVSALPGAWLVLFGFSQILVAGILAYLLLFNLDSFPASLMTGQILYACGSPQRSSLPLERH
jgi:hypothetical protein